VREYETTFIVQPEISDEVRDGFLAKLDGQLVAKGGVRLMLDDWGKRKLAYEIQNFQKGHYYSLKYLDDGSAVAELERLLKIEESILRYLTVRVAADVTDIEARKVEAAEEERKLHDRLEAERVAREEEERARREAEARAAVEAAANAEASAAGSEAADEDSGDDEGDAEGDAEPDETDSDDDADPDTDDEDA
jgi:small subunit ribosomal protein S6